MAKVLGVGGVFFKAADPKAVRDWYARVLGFEISEWGGAMWPHPAIGLVNWTVHEASTDYYDPSTQPFMVNYIVDDLEGMLAKVRAEGVEPVGQELGEPYGKFAWLIDPAGVKIELWEPPANEPEA